MEDYTAQDHKMLNTMEATTELWVDVSMVDISVADISVVNTSVANISDADIPVDEL